jgi:sugar phosphate isomerase/epimerase
MPSKNQSRRKFIGNVAGASLALSLGKMDAAFANMGNNSANPPEIMVFSKQLEWIKDRNELCELVSKIGFNGLELTVRPKGYVLPERVEDDLPLMVEAAKKAGIKIIMIATRITDPNDPGAERTLKTASQLGIKMYRMGGLKYDESKSIEKNLAEFKAIFKDLSQLNEEYNIHGAYQNHAGSNRVSASVWDLWYLLKDLDPEWIGCQYDTRHSQLEGGSWWPIGLQLIHPFIKTTVVKDFKWAIENHTKKVQNCPIGTGEVDFESYFQLVKKMQIAGPISLHFPYTFVDNMDKLSFKEKLDKTAEFMQVHGINKLKSMLHSADIN